MVKMVLLVIASQGYQPLEYSNTREELEKVGIKIVVASDKPGPARSMFNSVPYSTATVDFVISDIKPENYDGIFLVGGSGALGSLDNQVTYQLLKKFHNLNKPLGAICISPRILAKAEILTGKSATGWDGDGKLQDVFKAHKVTFVNQSVVKDGNIITANGPSAAREFGKAIVQVLTK